MERTKSSRWLEELIRQVDIDRDELVATIEGHKAAVDEKHAAFLPTLTSALTNQTSTIDRRRQANTLLANAAALLEVYNAANANIETTFGGRGAFDVVKAKLDVDVQRAKDVMLAGKRLCAGELAGVEQQAKARELFGGGGMEVGEGVERSLGYVEKGVRGMVKGMD